MVAQLAEPNSSIQRKAAELIKIVLRRRPG